MSVLGRYPFKSAWAFKGWRNSGRFMICRPQVRWNSNNYIMWLNWFWGDDGIKTGFGVIKRWTRNGWVEARNIKVKFF